jgi:hypothetical protein
MRNITEHNADTNAQSFLTDILWSKVAPRFTKLVISHDGSDYIRGSQRNPVNSIFNYNKILNALGDSVDLTGNIQSWDKHKFQTLERILPSLHPIATGKNVWEFIQILSNQVALTSTQNKVSIFKVLWELSLDLCVFLFNARANVTQKNM